MTPTTILLVVAGIAPSPAEDLRRVGYSHAGLTVDLGVGLWAWPLPMDYDGDGDHDLVVSCPDVPYNGTYFFENRSGTVTMPVFRSAVRIAPGKQNIRVSPVGSDRVLTPGVEYQSFRKQQLSNPFKLPAPSRIHEPAGRIRANQWQWCDYDGDAKLDLIVGIDDWSDYGWDDAFNEKGEWTRGPLRGFVYVLRNRGTAEQVIFDQPERITIGNRPLEVFGWPSPNFADWDDDGDLDLICGEFLDRLRYFENVGSRSAPKYAAARVLQTGGRELRMELEMIVPTAIDWDKDGDVDLIVGEEDGRVAFLENSGRMVGRLPEFLVPRHFQQEADYLKFGALVTPCSVDWDDDGDEDLICGNTAGHIGFIENLTGGTSPKWNAPRRLEAAGEVIRIQAGPNGSIQGPAEAKWGYTTVSVADWNHDGLLDIVANSIWGKVHWYENVGERKAPKLKAAQPLRVDWSGPPPKPAWNWWEPAPDELATQWRTTPVVVDWNKDGHNDLVMLDHEGFLAFFERSRKEGSNSLLPGRRIIVDETGSPLQLNAGQAGKSGRRKLHLVDWNRDGRLDLLIDGVNADWFENLGERNGMVVLKKRVPLAKQRLAGHDTSPTTVDWNKDGIPELLVGAEDGHFYYLPR